MSRLRSGRSRRPPHVDMKRLGDVDFEAARPGAVGGVHEPDTQQLVVVVTGPVEDHTGARQGGDVAVGIGCALRQTHLAEMIWVVCQSSYAATTETMLNKSGGSGFNLHVSAFLPFLLQTPSEQRLICEWTCCPAGSEERRSQCECPCSDLFLSTR